MIIARSPLRISLGGGGTDLPSYYRQFGGLVVSAAIDKYVYVAVNRTFLPHLLIRYSQIETVGHPRDVAHPIVREALALLGIEETNLEITTLADIPAGTGLGSSGSFTTALMKALYKHQRQLIEPRRLAELACHIEIERLGEPSGKQDPYAAAFGGISAFAIAPSGEVSVEPLAISQETLERLGDGLLMFSTGIVRRSTALLADQDQRTREGDAAMLDNLHTIRRLGEASRAALLRGDVDELGRLMHEHWLAKRARSQGMTSDRIDAWYERGRAAGALGGKLIGAGGGGFLLFVTADPVKLRAGLAGSGLVEMRFGFDFEGTKVL